MFVDSNVIRGGCSPIATGVETNDSYARLQNNRIFGVTVADCGPGGNVNVQESYGLRAFVDAGNHEVDVHSNDIDGTGSANAGCLSRGIQIEAGPTPPVSGMGTFRNNIVLAGVCGGSRFNVLEAVMLGDPRVFENNDLAPIGAPTALYRDEGMNDLSIMEVNTLLGATFSGNMAVDPLFVSYPADVHLQAASPCVGAGTPAGEPTTDFEGTKRDPVKPDIGADEL